tara:strand:- start:42 stop:1040 length:999 start_codon:yes stop_codon:yes gene_type:complete
MITVPGTGQTIGEDLNTEIDSAKAWVFNKSAKLSEMNDEHTAKTMSQINSQNYMDDISYMDGTNPNTYTNQKKNYIEELLTDEIFTPPNESAQELWGEYIQTFKQDQINKAIGVELQPRINAKVQQITNGVNLHAKSIRNNPSLYNQSLLEFHEVMGEDNNFIPPSQTKELIDTTKQLYKTSYIQGMLAQDPKSLMMEITAGKHQDISEIQLNKYYLGALNNYRITASQDISAVGNMLYDEFRALLENGGDLQNSALATLDPKTLSSDEMMLKLTMQSDWFDNVALEEMEGRTFIFDNNKNLIEALNEGRAIPVNNVAQGKRMIKQLARMLG